MLKQNKCLVFILVSIIFFLNICFAQELKEEIPVILNGDKVEFFAELEKAVAEGNVVVKHGTMTLTCDRITVFTKTKDAFAEGNVKLEDERGAIEGKSLFYNFEKKEGKIIDSRLKALPYFCVAPEAKKFPTKFILYNADITTCNLDKPHYHFHGKEIEIIPGDKIRAKGVTFVAGKVPMMYFPKYAQSIVDKRQGFSFTGGSTKEWGDFFLTTFRYYLTDDTRGLIRYDWRANKGFGYGFDFETNSKNFGDSRLQYYYVRETLHGKGEVEPIFKDPDRYKIEYRNKWDIDDKNHFIMEFSRYSDANFLKNYFYRQYERIVGTSSYVLLSHSFPSSTLSLMLQKRINQFSTETEKIPEIKFSTSKALIKDFFTAPTDNVKIDTKDTIDTLDTKDKEYSLLKDIYFRNDSSITSFTMRTANTNQDEDTVRLDSYNQLSFPFKLAFLNLEPYVATRYTLYSKDKNGDEKIFRNVFYSGHSILTKIYRTFSDIKVNSYGFEIDKLRHIITPSLTYSYIHTPTLPSSRLTSFDSVDSISKANTLTLSLQNQLQTKRSGDSVDFLNFSISSPYNFKQEAHGGRFGDITFDLEMLPNSWLRYESDAAFDLRRRSFRNANFSLNFPFDSDKGSVGAEYRYSEGGDDSEVFTFSFERRLNPKWKIRTYHRIEFNIRHTLKQQVYTISRDLHCWEWEFSVDSSHKKGMTLWFVFRCKAFPELGIDFEKGHKMPKAGYIQ